MLNISGVKEDNVAVKTTPIRNQQPLYSDINIRQNTPRALQYQQGVKPIGEKFYSLINSNQPRKLIFNCSLRV